MTGELVNRTVEIWYDGAWHDITADTRNTSPHQITRGVSNRGSSADPANLGLTLNNGESSVASGVVARYALRNPRSDLYELIGPNTPIRLSAGLVGDTPTVRTVQEIVALPPRWDVSGRDRWVPLSGSGILRRLGIPSSPLEPALTRAAPRDPGIVAHWSLAGLRQGAIRAPSSVPGVGPLRVRNRHLVEWSADSSAPGLGACPTVQTASTKMVVAGGSVPPGAEGFYGWSVWGRGDLDEDLSADLITTVSTDSTSWVLTVGWRAATSEIDIDLQAYDPDAGTELDSVSNVSTIAITAGWRNITVLLEESGADAIVSIYIDNESVLSTSFSGVDVGAVTDMEVRASLLAGRGLSFGSPLLFRGRGISDMLETASRLYRAGRGYDAEEAGDRVERLCLEQAVSIAGPGAQVATDDFGRTEAGGWGTASSGQAWTTEGGDAADYSVSSGQAHIEIDTLNSVRQTYLDVDVEDVDVYATFYPNQTFAGGPAEAGITVRTKDGDNLFEFVVQFQATGLVTAIIAAVDGGTPLTLVQVQLPEPLSYTASSAIRMRGQIRLNLLRMKLWDAEADVEPAPWLVDIAAGGLISEAGSVGVRMSLHSSVSNTLPVTMSVDDLVVRTAPTTAPMGVQQPGAFLDVLGECAKLEAAGSRAPILTEQRDELGLRFTPLSSLYLPRDPDLILDYEEGQLSAPFDPTPDDFGLVNDAVASRSDGGAARIEVYAGRKGITRAGRYDAGEEFAAASDEHLDGIARWWTLHATWDEDRYPAISINMRSLSTRTDGAALVAAVQALDEGALVRITNLPAEITEDVEQIVLGITETCSVDEWIVELHTTPARPYTVGVLDDTTYGILQSDSATVDEALDTTETGVDIDCGGGPDWVHEIDFDVVIGGERVTVTAVGAMSGTFPHRTCTLTVVRSVNGIVKEHAAGTPVAFAPKTHIGAWG